MNSEKQSTASTILLGIGVVASFSSTASNTRVFTLPELQAYQAQYNLPSKEKSTIERYVINQYSKLEKDALGPVSLKGNFLNIVQTFGESQITLDSDFSDALNELLISKIKTAPSKRRF